MFDEAAEMANTYSPYAYRQPLRVIAAKLIMG